MKTVFREKGFALFGLVMVVATITLVGLVAFRFLDAQDNTEVATNSSTSKIAKVNSADDVEKVTEQLDTTELDTLDSDLDASFDF